MALFSKETETETKETQSQGTSIDDDFLSQYAGQGLEGLAGGTDQTYLGIVQTEGSAVDEGHAPGTWLISTTRQNLGNKVNVVVADATMAWIERDSQAPFNTVGRYPIDGIAVKIEPVPAGRRGFPKMVNPQTGNEVQELPVYALLLIDYLDEYPGIVVFSPTRGSMRALKAWNTQLRTTRLPNGLIAPVFAYSWTLELEVLKKGANNGKVVKDHVAITKVSRGQLIQKNLFTSSVQPALTASSSLLMLAAPESTGND